MFPFYIALWEVVYIPSKIKKITFYVPRVNICGMLIGPVGLFTRYYSIWLRTVSTSIRSTSLLPLSGFKLSIV